MTKQIEAMKLALEALQKIYIAPEHEDYIKVWWPACEQAITALREALAEQPAPSQYGSPELQAMIVARAMEKNAAEQPAQQEPVALVDGEGKQLTLMQALDHAIKATEKTGSGRLNKVLVTAKRALAEQPAQPSKPWVGLTDEERGQAINANFGTGLWAMAKDIEAKLREKNT